MGFETDGTFNGVRGGCEVTEKTHKRKPYEIKGVKFQPAEVRYLKIERDDGTVLEVTQGKPEETRKIGFQTQ